MLITIVTMLHKHRQRPEVDPPPAAVAEREEEKEQQKEFANQVQVHVRKQENSHQCSPENENISLLSTHRGAGNSSHGDLGSDQKNTQSGSSSLIQSSREKEETKSPAVTKKNGHPEFEKKKGHPPDFCAELTVQGADASVAITRSSERKCANRAHGTSSTDNEANRGIGCAEKAYGPCDEGDRIPILIPEPKAAPTHAPALPPEERKNATTPSPITVPNPAAQQPEGRMHENPPPEGAAYAMNDFWSSARARDGSYSGGAPNRGSSTEFRRAQAQADGVLRGVLESSRKPDPTLEPVQAPTNAPTTATELTQPPTRSNDEAPSHEEVPRSENLEKESRDPPEFSDNLARHANSPPKDEHPSSAHRGTSGLSEGDTDGTAKTKPTRIKPIPTMFPTKFQEMRTEHIDPLKFPTSSGEKLGIQRFLYLLLIISLSLNTI